MAAYRDRPAAQARSLFCLPNVEKSATAGLRRRHVIGLHVHGGAAPLQISIILSDCRIYRYQCSLPYNRKALTAIGSRRSAGSQAKLACEPEAGLYSRPM